MDEILFRSSQRLEKLQVQMALTANESKELFSNCKQQSKVLVSKIWQSSLVERAKHRVKDIWILVINLTGQWHEKFLYHFNIRKIFRNMAKVFIKKWSRRDMYFVTLGFILGLVAGAALGLYLSKNEPIKYYMQAIQCTHYLGIESVHVVEDAVAPHHPKENEVIITVKAGSVNVIDAKICSGYGNLIRQILRRLRQNAKSLPITLGRDCAGVVVDTGSNIRRLEIGDEVWLTSPFWAQGLLSQSVAVPESLVGRKPSSIGFEASCSLPYAGSLALNALKKAEVDAYNARSKRIFIQDCCSPVGCVLIQILKYWNAQITVSCYKKSEQVARALGAKDIICLENNEEDRSQLLKELEIRELYDIMINTKDCGLTIKHFQLYLNSNGVAIETIPMNLRTDNCNFFTSYLVKGYARFKYYLEIIFGITFDDFDDVHLCHVTLDEISKFVENGCLQTVVDKVYHPQDIEIALKHIQSIESIGSTVITFR